MSSDEIDQLLSSEEPVEPSSGFAASVMQAVRQEAAAPAPLEFPWRKAIPGIGALGVAVAAMIVVAVVAVLRPASVDETAALASLAHVTSEFLAQPGGTLMLVGVTLSLAAMLFGLKAAFSRR